MEQKLYRPSMRRQHRFEARPQSRPLPVDGSSEFAAARGVARDLVARRWPELAAVEPVASLRSEGPPACNLLERIELDASEVALCPDHQYTFTFAGEAHSPEGERTPRVARVTVDTRCHVVKAVLTK